MTPSASEARSRWWRLRRDRSPAAEPTTPIFRDPAFEQRFRTDGFVVVPLFDPTEAAAIAATYASLEHNSVVGDDEHHHELQNDDYDRKLAVRDVLLPRFEARASALFEDYVPRATAFIRKPSDDGGDSEPHVDPSFIDESTGRSVMIWCSLTGVQQGGGLLWLAPGSHRLAHEHRAHLDPANSFCDLLDDIVSGLGSPVPLAAGEAVIFDHGTMHWAEANSGGAVQLIAQSALTPAGAQLRYVYYEGPGRGVEYAVDEDFFLRFPLDAQPGPEVLADYRRVQEVELTLDKAGKEDFDSARSTRR